MIKKFIAFVTFIAMLNFTVAFAAQSIIDKQNLLTPEEINSLTKKIQMIEQKHQIKIGIEFLKNTHGQSLDNAANSLLDKNFSGAPNGGILLLVVMDTRKWKIATDSTMRQIISDSETESIAKNFIGNLSRGDYYEACDSYIESVDNFLMYYENGVNFNDSAEFDPLALGLAFFLAIISGFMFRSALIGSMSNVHQATSATDYLKRDTVKITDKKDTFLFMNVTRRRKSKGRSSTQSSGSSRGGGGGSHGGSSGSF